MEIRPPMKIVWVETPAGIYKGKEFVCKSIRFPYGNGNLNEKYWKKYLEEKYQQGINKCLMYTMFSSKDKLMDGREMITLWIRCVFVK